MNTTDLDLTLSVREEANLPEGVAAVLDGVAVPYGTTIDLGGVRETFAEGAFDPADVVGRPLCWRHGEPIGKVTEATADVSGLSVSAEITDTALGRDAAALVRSGAVTGLSVGFEPMEDIWDKAKTTVTRAKAKLRELSLTHMPAYETALVGTIREENPMQDTTEDTKAVSPEFATREEVQSLRDRVASITVVERERPAPTAGEYLRAYADRLLSRAWTDVTVDGTPSDVSPVPSEISARITLGRPTVSAIGVSALPPTGMDAIWFTPKTRPTVGPQSAEKTEIPSGPAGGQQISRPVETIAGGNDLSIQFIQRAHGYDLDAYLMELADEYAANFNSMVLTELAVGIAATQAMGTGDLTTSALGSALGKAASKIATAVKTAPDLLILDPATFFEVAAVSGNGYPVGGGNVGNGDLASMSYTAFGLRVICEPDLSTPGLLLASRFVGIKESLGAPFTMSANVPSKLGVDYAAYGFGAAAVLNAGGGCALTRGAVTK